MKIKLFWKENCPKCPAAKMLVEQFEEVESYNVEDSEGLAEAAFYGIMSTPSIVIADEVGKEIVSWRSDVPDLEDVKKWLS